MHPIYIFGHKNPDTDTICATIAYADYKAKKGFNVKPVRLGDLNDETEFVLKYFGVSAPEVLKTIKRQVSDLDIEKPYIVNPETSLKDAWTLMCSHHLPVLAVSENNRTLQGIVTISDITQTYMDIGDEALLSKSSTPLKNILETLQAVIICGNTESFHMTGRVLVAALEHDRLKYFIKEGDIVIAGNREETIIESINEGATLIIITCNVIPSAAAIEAAQKLGCLILCTPNDTFNTARLIHQSVPVRHVMIKDNILSFKADDFIEDVQEVMLKTRYRNYPVTDEHQSIVGMLSRYHLISKKRKQAILVDHNEKSQTVYGIEEAQILEIIDHHRLGDIQTSSPILMKNEPVGSTSTIIAKLFLAEEGLLTPNIAGLLLAAIISDTLKFLSPTSTAEDVEIADALAEKADIDINEFAIKLFNAGSNFNSKSADEIINGDLKEYQLGRYKIGMSQVYSTDSESLHNRKDELMERLLQVCKSGGFALLALLITDLNRNGSEIMFTGHRGDLIRNAFDLDVDAESAFLPGVLSRKKQVVPLIMTVSENLGI